MRELARRFRADESFEPEPGERPERYELRLLPQPVARYEDPASGVIDGGLFLLVYGQNPEIAVVIEARSQGDAPPIWTYGMGRISAARSHVHLDDREVADLPRINDNALYLSLSFGPRAGGVVSDSRTQRTGQSDRPWPTAISPHARLESG